MPRLRILLSLLLVAFSVTAQESMPRSLSLLAVPGPLDPAEARLAHKLLPAYYGDHGALALGAGDADSLAALRDAGLVALDLGPLAEREELWLIASAHAPSDLAAEEYALREGAARDGRLLLRHLGVDLIAVETSLSDDTAPQPSACGHHGPRRIDLTPQRLGVGFRAPLGAAEGVSVDARITPLVAAVQGSNIQALVASLSAISSRRADESGILQARDILLAELALIPGLDSVSTHNFNAQFAPNVVAEITGSVHPERVLVLGAHYDSINGAGPGTVAPGADDNASGSGGLLEAARRLSTIEFENSVRLVWFSAEEFGLVGAGAYADALLTEGVQPVGMLNMDMISHLEAGDLRDLDFATNSTDAGLTQFCRDVGAAYVPGLPTVAGVLTAGSSDHAAFQARGIPSAFFFEDLQQFSSVIHTSADLLGTSANDFTLAADIVRVFVASAATLAGPVDMQLSHTPLADTSDASGPFVVDAQVEVLAGGAVDTVELVVRVDGGPEQFLAMLPGLAPDQWLGSVPGGAPSARVEYYLLATNTEGQQQWLPESLGAGEQRYVFQVGVQDIAFAPDFDGPNDAGFGHVQLATQDDWQRDAPSGASGDPSSAASGTKIWGNDLGISGFNGAYQPNVFNRLSSPSFSTLGKTDLRLGFQRWLTVEDADFDQARVLVNGVEVWSNPTTADLIDTSWTSMDLDVSALADNQPSVQIEFELQSDGGVEFGGWNIDDLKLAALEPGTLAELRHDTAQVSISQGGTIDYTLDLGPSFGGRSYILIMGLSGTSPGTSLGSATLPINFDAWTNFGLRIAAVGNPLVPGFAGTLSPQGTATAQLIVPALAVPEAVGLTISTAALTMFPIDAASNAVDVLVLP